MRYPLPRPSKPRSAPAPTSRAKRTDIAGESHAQTALEQSAQPPIIQTKSRVDPANSPDEQEADRIAEQLFGGASRQGSAVSRYQSNPEDTAQPRAGQSSPPHMVSLKRAHGATSTPRGQELSSKVESDLGQARSGGEKMPPQLQRNLEQAFGANFGGVRVHTDYRAQKMNSGLAARAFTSGQDIFFQKGEYSPSSREGQRLLAHELTHVTQQQPQVLGQEGSGGASPSSGAIQRMPDEEYLDALADAIEELFFELSDQDYALVESSISGSQDLSPNTLLNFLYAKDKSAADFRTSIHIKAYVKELFGVKANYSDDDKGDKKEQAKSKKNDLNKKLPTKRDLKNSQQKSQKLVRQVTDKNIIPENLNDIAVPQGFVVAKNKDDMIAGLFTNGVATCTAIGISDEAMTAFAFTHLDGEADIAKSIDYMIELVDSKKSQQDDQQIPKYRAWIGAASTDSDNGGQFNLVKLELTWRNNIKIEYENEKMGQFSLDPHRSDNPAEMMKPTRGNKVPYAKFRDALVKEDAKPLPLKQDRHAEIYRKKATEYLCKLLGKLVKVMPKDNDASGPFQKMFPNAPAFWGVCEKVVEQQIVDLDSGYIFSIVEELLAIFTNKPDLFGIEKPKPIQVVLQMALFNMQKYFDSVNEQNEQLAFLQGVEIALMNAQALV